MKSDKSIYMAAPLTNQSVTVSQTARPRFLRLPEVKAMSGLSKASIYKRMAAQEFPQSIKLGSRITVWIESEVVKWIDSSTHSARTLKIR